MPERFIVTPGPHINSGLTTERIMREVFLALVPASAAAVYFFGLHALWIILTAIAVSVATEWVIQKLTRRPVTVSDGSAALTGLLLALVIPPTVPLWIPVIGSVFAIALAKQVFGGLGSNPLNPALIGRAFLTLSYPSLLTGVWAWPKAAAAWLSNSNVAVMATGKVTVDAITSATPLKYIKELPQAIKVDPAQLGQVVHQLQHFFVKPLFIGSVAGSLGETSALALLIGAAYLLARKIIDWRIPAAYLGTVAIMALLYGQNPLFHLLAGGLIIGAFFMATDYVTSPKTHKGRIIFGIGAGLLTMLIRLFGGYPEGVCYSILIMNAFAPLIDRFCIPRKLGEVKARA